MSAIRNPATITSVGRRMMTAGGDITYTKAVLYGQDISHLTREQLESLTSIGNPLVTVPLGISDKNDNGNGTTVILEATFQNSNLKADLPYTAVGFFAKRGDDAEKLIAVGVATEGAYLAATSPDGVATDALDIKVAIAIGDSANVTAMIDPAGSVTPAALHNAITDVKSEMKTGLDTKADKSTVDSDVKSINDTLATKADKQTVTDDLATKADKTDVDAQIGTVNKSVSDLSDTVKANKDDTDKVLATKADKATVESDLATKANQSDLDKTNSEVAKKADSEDVNAQLATKANSKDVNAALALKDDTADVDDKISNVTKSVSDLSATVTANKKATDSTLATKANASDVADSLATKADKTDVASDVKSLNDAINTKASQADLDKTNAVVATKANATALADYARTVDVDADLDTKANKTDLESLAKTADVNSALDTKADKTTVDSDVKSINDTLATKADKQTVTDDLVKKADKTDVDAQIGTVNKSVSDLSDTVKANQKATDTALDTKADKTTVNQELATKANSSDLTALDKKAVKSVGIYPNDLNFTNGQFTNWSSKMKASPDDNGYALIDLSDDTSAQAAANQLNAMLTGLNHLQGKQTKDSADANALSETGVYYCSSPAKNFPVSQRGTLVTSNGNGARASQLYFPDDNSAVWFRTLNGDWRGWVRLANIGDVNNAESSLTSSINAVNNKVNVTVPLFRRITAGNTWNDILGASNFHTPVLVSIRDNGGANTLGNFSAAVAFGGDDTKGVLNVAYSEHTARIIGGNGNAPVWHEDIAWKSDVTNLQNQVNTKANSTDVDDKLAAKADSADVTKQIKTITDLANTKADQTALDATNATVATKANSANVTAELAKKDNTADVDAKIKTVTDLANTKANSVDVTAALDKKDDTSDVDAKIKVVTDLTNTKANANDVYNRSSVDNAFTEVRGRLSKLEGTQTLDSPDFNGITASGVYYITNNNGANIKNNPVDQWGVLIVSNGNGHRVSQVYYPDDGNPPWYRSLDESTWRSWYQLSTRYDVNNAVSLANKAQDTANQANTNISKIDLSPYAKTADVNKEIKTVTDLANTKVGADYSYSKAELDKKLLALSTDTSGKVNASQVASMIAGKADKTDVDQKIATVNKSVSDLSDTVSANKTATDASLATKANASDVADNVKTLQANIDTKADKATVDAEIAKIDFTPYAKSADVANELQNYTTTVDLNKLLAGKEDAGTSYSKAELDKKLLALSTDTDGKVNADQVSSMIANKVDKSDLASDLKSINDSIATKANTTDVNAALAKKDDTTDVDAKIKTVIDLANTKADKTDVTAQFATKADKTTVEQELAVKANSADVYTKKQVDDALSSRDTAIATKADKATVDGEIGKIDFSPYAKIVDVYSKTDANKLLDAKADKTALNSYDTITDVDSKIKTVTDLANTKVDATYSYSKAELDKKLLALSTDTSGKVNASQVASMIAGKADKTDVDQKIATVNKSVSDLSDTVSANKTATDASLATKANASDVADNVKTLQANIDTKADKSTVDSDVKSINDTLATKADKQTVTDDLVKKADKTDVDAQIGTVNKSVSDLSDTVKANQKATDTALDTKADKTTVNQELATKANSSDLTALDKKAVKSVGIYPNDLNFTNGQFTNWSSKMKASPDDNGYALIDLSDDTSAQAAANQLNAMLTGLNHLQGKQTKDSADANALSETGVYYCSSPAKNFPVSQRGTLVTSNGNGARASQLYFPDDNSAVWFRTLNGDWRGWVRLANIGDVNNAESSLTSSINAVNNKVNVTVPLFRRITAGNTWNDILGASNFHTPVLVSIRDNGGANTLGNFSAAVAFGGDDTKGVLNVAYSEHTARIIGGNGNAPVWHEDIAWKSDVTNLQNQVNTKASASDVNSLNQTISALQQTVQSLQNTVNQQATQITGLQTQVNNQANEISYIKANYIEGKRFAKADESQATAWEKENSQRIAFIEDK